MAGGTKFSKPMEETSKDIHLRAAIDRFLRLPLLKKSFFIISCPAFTAANKVLENL